MRNAAFYTPIAGISQNVNLLYNDGAYEIINASPFTLTVNGIGGGVIVEAGAKVLYGNVEGGTSLQIVPTYPFTLLADGSIQTIDNPPFTIEPHFIPNTYDLFVVVNEYRDGEIDSSAYPTAINNLAFPSVPNQWFNSIEISGVSSTSLSLMPQASGRFLQLVNTTQNAYLLGFDFFGGARSAIMNHIITLSNILAPNASTAYDLFFVTSSTTSGGPQLQVRFPTPLLNRGPRYAIGLAVNTLDSTLTYVINSYGFYQ